MSSAHARRESRPAAPGIPSDAKELAAELRRYVKKLKIIERLQAYGRTLSLIDGNQQVRKAHAFLLELDTSDENSLIVRYFDSDVVAAEQYSALERAIEGQPTKDAVLVRADSLAALRKAYPNYFLDTTAFLLSVEEAIR